MINNLTTASAIRPALPVLTTLRFFAAAEVVVYHEAPRIENNFLRGLGSAGYEAVTFFFVLSGFILTYVYSGRSELGCLNTPTRKFWKARFARISPGYFLGLLLALPHWVYSALISRMISFPDFVLGLALVPILQQAWWPPAAMAWNAPAWSLSVEFLFYVCFPMLTIAAARLSRNYFFLLAYGLVIAVAVLRYVICSPSNACGGGAWKNFVMYFPFFHLPQFIFGMALGRIYLFGPTISRRIHVAMLCTGAIGLILIFGGRSLLPSLTHTDATLVLLFGLVIFGGARAEGIFKVGAFPAFVLLGEASYSIYILHMPFGWWWNWLTRGLSLPITFSFIAYFVLLLVISVLSYLYLEKPLRRRILGHRAHRAA